MPRTPAAVRARAQAARQARRQALVAEQQQQHQQQPGPSSQPQPLLDGEPWAAEQQPAAKRARRSPPQTEPAVYVVEAILGQRAGARGRQQFLVKWLHYDGPGELTWEERSAFVS